MASYNSSSSQHGVASAPNHTGSDGKLFLVDEKNGHVIGELGAGHQVIEDAQIKASKTDPVEITLPSSTSSQIKVTPSYLEMARHPIYQNSTLVSRASTASRLIVNTSGYVCKTLQSQADSYVQKTKPNAKPLTFEPATHARIRKVCNLTEGAANLSAKTVGQVQKYAQNFGASVARNERVHYKGGIGPDGKPIESYKPGLLNKGIVAFSTIADGIDQAGRNLLSGTSTAATTIVGHKYGPEAGDITKYIGTGVKNVGLVYIDAAGVTRKAIIKSVAKGMVIGKMPGGTKIIADGNGGYQLSNPTPSTYVPHKSDHKSYGTQKIGLSSNNPQPKRANNSLTPHY